MIPNNHLLVKIDKMLDLSFIYELTENLYCKDNGRQSIDPVVFFRMQIINYLYGIRSERQLCEEIHLNIAYRWFCRLNLEDKVPDHSSLTKIRERFSVKTYQNIFETLVKQLQASGLIQGRRMISDASLIEANASIDSMVERNDADPNARELKYYEQRYHDFKEGKKQRRISNQTHVSKTDPDATLVSKKTKYNKLCYKVHYSIDAKSRVITDCFTTTGARHECTILPERIEYQLNSFKFQAEEWIADKGYGRGPTYGYLREKKIRAYIPLHEDNLGEGKLSRGEFKYERKKDRYKCPEGNYLYPYKKVEGATTKRYRMVGGHCQECPLRESCLPDNYQHRARFIYRSLYQDEIDKIKKRQITIHFKKKLTERKWKIEGLFGEAKENHSLRRAKYRGIGNAQIQCYMIAMIQNIKRLIAFILLLFLATALFFENENWERKNYLLC